MKKETRYQGAIVRDYKILLICHREHGTRRKYWLLPGGRMEPGESEKECVRREIKEETGLDVDVDRLLVEEVFQEGMPYKLSRTFLCHSPKGEAFPGHEPEKNASAKYTISEIKWLDLRYPENWEPEIINDQVAFLPLLKIKEAIRIS